MKQERKEELMVRWMDGELSTSEKKELQPFLDADSELREMASAHEMIRKELQSGYRDGDVPYGDFFQTKLERAIQIADAADKPVSPKLSSVGGRASWREAFRWALAPVAVGAMALAFLAGTKVTTDDPTNLSRAVPSGNSVVYTPEGGVSADFFAESASGTSVIVLEGLQPLPDSIDLMASRETTQSDASDFQLINAESKRTMY
jgi:anti-sigma factor RsiW